MQLNPLETFTVVRQIEDHLDTNTYYVRAVIRNAKTDAIITTLDLTNQGGQRFTKNWQVSPDVSGQGYYISIVTSVYTDSGYTTKSENYGDKEQTFLIQARMNNALGGSGGGGGPDIDYKKIRKIMDELLKIRLGLGEEDHLEMPQIPQVIKVTKEVPAPIEFPKIPEAVDLSPVLAMGEAIMELIEAMRADKDPNEKAEHHKKIDRAVKSIETMIKRYSSEITSKVGKEINDQTLMINEKIESELSNVGGMLEETPVVRFPDIKTPQVLPEKKVDKRISRILTKI